MKIHHAFPTLLAATSVLVAIQANAGHVAQCLSYSQPMGVESDSIRYFHISDGSNDGTCVTSISVSGTIRCAPPPPYDSVISSRVSAILNQANGLRNDLDSELTSWLKSELGDDYKSVSASINGPIGVSLRRPSNSSGVVTLSFGGFEITGTARRTLYLGPFQATAKINARASNVRINASYNVHSGTATVSIDDALDVDIDVTGSGATRLVVELLPLPLAIEIFERVLERGAESFAGRELAVLTFDLDEIPVGSLSVGSVDVGQELRGALEDLKSREPSIEDEVYLSLEQSGKSLSDAYVHGSLLGYQLTVGAKNNYYWSSRPGPATYCP